MALPIEINKSDRDRASKVNLEIRFDVNWQGCDRNLFSGQKRFQDCLRIHILLMVIRILTAVTNII